MIVFISLIAVGCILSLLGWAIMSAASDPDNGSFAFALIGALLVCVSIFVFSLAIDRIGAL